MFYRPGGSVKAINRQYDNVYADFVGATTGWLPVSNGNVVAINIARATIQFVTPASSTVIKNAIAPECEVVMELKSFGIQSNSEVWPIDRWQNLVVATSRRINMDGWVRLRILGLNNVDGNGIAMGLQVNRNSGASGVRVDA